MKTATNHHRPFSTSLAVAAGALAIGLGCKPPIPDTGIYIECNSNGKNTYTKYYPNMSCVDEQGNVFLGCKAPAAVEHLGWCYEPDEWLASDTGMGGETGGENPGHGIYRSGWPTHEPSLTCDEATCPIYLGNLTLTNVADHFKLKHPRR